MLHGATATAVLITVWAGAIGGVILSVAWIDAPRWLATVCYLAISWVAVATMPQMISDLGVGVVSLFWTGGLLYTAGAAIYATRRPDPWPKTFGFHEIFHVLVTAAAIVHFVAIAGWVIPASPAA